MTTILVKEVYKATADPMVLDDVDKVVIIYNEEGVQKKAVDVWSDFETKSKFEEVLKKAIPKTKKEKEYQNISMDWRGEYNI